MGHSSTQHAFSSPIMQRMPAWMPLQSCLAWRTSPPCCAGPCGRRRQRRRPTATGPSEQGHCCHWLPLASFKAGDAPCRHGGAAAGLRWPPYALAGLMSSSRLRVETAPFGQLLHLPRCCCRRCAHRHRCRRQWSRKKAALRAKRMAGQGLPRQFAPAPAGAAEPGGGGGGGGPGGGGASRPSDLSWIPERRERGSPRYDEAPWHRDRDRWAQPAGLAGACALVPILGRMHAAGASHTSA